jgi:protein CpxP
MRQSFRQTVLITSAMLGLSAMTALAAPPPGAGSPVNTNAATMPSTNAPAGAASNDQAAPSGQNSMQATVEQHIQDLQTKLQITPQQKAQWDRFTAVMRENAQDMDKLYQARAQAIDSMNAEANMKSYAEMAEHHAQDVRRLVPAFDTLYASMSSSQKQTADQVFREDAMRANHQGETQGKNG